MNKRKSSGPTVLLTLGLALGIFAWWGMFTRSGNRAFDEMAGMIPYAAGLAAGVLLVAGIVWRLMRRG